MIQVYLIYIFFLKMIAPHLNQLGSGNDLKSSIKLNDEIICTAINKMLNNENLISNNNLKTLIISPRIEAQNILNLKVKQVILITSIQNQAKFSRLSLNKNDILLLTPNPQFVTQKSQIPSTLNYQQSISNSSFRQN